MVAIQVKELEILKKAGNEMLPINKLTASWDWELLYCAFVSLLISGNWANCCSFLGNIFGSGLEAISPFLGGREYDWPKVIQLCA